MNSITLQDLFIDYGDISIKLQKDLSFEDKKSYLILGPSGCGKSTLLKIIAGQLLPTSGTCITNGKFAYLSQVTHFLENFSVADNLNLVSSTVSAKEVAEVMNISHLWKKKARKLSGGERQRVSLSQTLLQESDILLLDEPTSALNQVLAHSIIERITAMKKLLLIVSHDTSLSKYFDHVIDISEVLTND